MNINKYLTIKEFATLCRTTARTIRFYDLQGLLKPINIDPFTKYRYYDPSQTRDFFRIKLLQNFDTPLEEVKKVGEIGEKRLVSGKLKAMRQLLVEKHKEYEVLSELYRFLFGNFDLMKDVKQETVESEVVFGMTVTDGRYDRINEDIVKLQQVAKEHGIRLTGRQIVTYLDNSQYHPQKTPLEITLTIQDTIGVRKENLPKQYFIKTQPQQKAYVYTYRGPFAYITFVYQKLEEEGILNKFPVVDRPFDIHLAGPWSHQSEYDHVTKICYPVK